MFGNTKYKSISIDGPAASGKSAVGKMLSLELKYNFLDTGIMYRAVTYISLLEKITPEIASTFFENTKLRLTTENSKNSLFYENKEITPSLYSKRIDSKVSQVSQKSIVRNNLVDFQRDLANKGNIVMVGRDISTIVLPNSNLKIFLRATLDIRAKRRAKEISSVDINIIKKSILRRDQIDSTRELSPLKIAKESFVIHTDELDIVEVVSEIKKLYEKIND